MTQPQKMGPSEALVETLAANGVTHVFGIVGSAFIRRLLDASSLDEGLTSVRELAAELAAGVRQ